MPLMHHLQIGNIIDKRIVARDNGICRPSHQPDECGTRPFSRWVKRQQTRGLDLLSFILSKSLFKQKLVNLEKIQAFR